jgi:hypothetical protein
VLTASISLPIEHYRTSAQTTQFFEQLMGNLQSLPGVQAGGVGSDLPWTGYDDNMGFAVEGRAKDFNDKTTARYHVASNDYFRAMGTPLLHGRFFTGHDDKDAPKVVIVNESMAKRYWPGESALEKRFSFASQPKETDWFRIIGVVGDIKDHADSDAARPAFWWPVGQMPFNMRDMAIAIRAGSDPAPLAGQLRLAIRNLDSGLALADVRLLREVADASVQPALCALPGRTVCGAGADAGHHRNVWGDLLLRQSADE